MDVYTNEVCAAFTPCAEDRTIGASLGSDRLLGIPDVAAITRTCPVTASRIIDETGCGIILHRRKDVLQSNLLKFFESQGVA